MASDPTGKTVSNIGPSWLEDRLLSGKVVLLDGATGTELQARGVPMHNEVWSGAALLKYPEILLSIHEDYVKAGSDVITANTFSCNRYMLEEAGFADLLSKLNEDAVALAKRAAEVEPDRKVAIAGSISGFMSRPDDPRWNSVDTVFACVEEQAQLLARAGVDIIVLEMMEQEEFLTATFEAAASTGLPVWVGCSCRRTPDGKMVVFDYPQRDFTSLAQTAISTGTKVINVMHSTVNDTTYGIQTINDSFDGVLGAYPNSGEFEMPSWRFVDVISPDNFAKSAIRWVEMGAQIIGGCCGLGPKHIEALKTRLSESQD